MTPTGPGAGEDERYRRTVTCRNGHEFTSASVTTWNGLYCPNHEDGWQCLSPLLDPMGTNLVGDLLELLDDLA